MSAVLAITGGIACGKSFFVEKALGLCQNCSSFSCDEEVSNLLTEKQIVRQLAKHFGDAILDKNQGIIDRSYLREKIFESTEARDQVEKILHPSVLKRATEFLKISKNKDLVLVEVPLLYEVDFPIERDFDVVVGCSQSTQIRRLEEKRNIATDEAERILAAQLSIQSKLDKADFVVWNDGTKRVFEEQIEVITSAILDNSV